MKYAPILIPTLCRYQHLVRLIESLKRNTWAKYTDIYIGLDYPPTEKYKEGYLKICEYLEGNFSEFASFNVIRHSQNIGSGENMEILRNLVFKKYDRFIRTDDDAEFSPIFIEYMDKCLMQYEGDDNVIAVTGYSYPIDWRVSEGSTVFKQNFTCSMWGTGFWRGKFLKAKNDIERGYLRDCVSYVLKNKLTRRMLCSCKFEYINLCLSQNFQETLAACFSDVAMRMYIAINSFYVISPTVSKVRNWGFDGSGEYCPITNKSVGKKTARNFQYDKQIIDECSDFKLVPDKLEAVEENKCLLDSFEDVSLSRKLRTNLKISLFRFVGLKTYQSLLKYLNRTR